MLEVEVTRTLNVGAEKAWSLLADWGNTRWMPGRISAEVIDTAEGRMRRFHIPGAKPIEETLLSIDMAARTLHYRIARSERFPFANYRGVVAVSDLSGSGCRIDWRCHFERDDLSEAEAEARAGAVRNLNHLLDHLARHLEIRRVVQWATGRVGMASLRAVIKHPGLELVGVHVHSAAKAGVDAGELCGLESVGVAATHSLEAIIALQPDCVLYMQEGYNPDDICSLLEAGINIVTTRSEFFNPKRMEAQLRERIEEACRRGGASLHATGVSPGFITEAMPLLLTSLTRRLDCLTIDEFAYIPDGCSADMLLQVLGYGRPAGSEFDRRLLAPIAQGFEDSLSAVADALSIPFDGVEVSAETAAGNCRVELGGGAAIEAGTVAALRVTVAGMRHGKPVMKFRANWYCTTDIDAAWDLKENGWRVVVEGDAPLNIDIQLPKTGDNIPEQMAGYTAFRAVNAVPSVCAAVPGIRTSVELPQLIARL